MKIKKLTVHGFKSFVDRTTLGFSSGTSGIIGPNGCGKSNIVDAIRWVLGEQNARHLRGKQMEDVIFNGSDLRKPLGMAEVVLTFSNESGLAPARFADYSEIEIARRLYRSGESEYYINKVQSRLRDVVDLFTDTGIGTRAYSIIEQGQVAWLINAKPEERRVIFEEAAGINKFKHKKEAALRRLEGAKENLTRVSDIISEVKRQLNSLNRQAKKAERYKAFREELSKVDLTLASIEYSRLTAEVLDAAKKLATMKDEEVKLSSATLASETLLAETKAHCEKVESEYASIKEKLYGLERRITEGERGIELSGMRVEELGRASVRLSAEILEIDSARTSAAVEADELAKKAGLLASEITEHSAKLNAATAGLDALARDVREAEGAQRAEAAESLKISSRLSEIKHAIQSVQREEEAQREKEARVSSEKENVLRSSADKAGPMNGLRETLNNFISRKEGAEAELAATRKTLDELEVLLKEKSAFLDALKAEQTTAVARLASLEEMERNFENINSGPKALLKRQDAAKAYGIIADAIDANPGFEKAVEAVLGERLQYVVVESMAEGIEAIEYLKRSSSGKTGIVSRQDTRPAASPVAVQANAIEYGDVRVLLNEVRIKDGYNALVSCLLGDAVIVEDLNAAVDLWKRSGEFRARTIVTKSGETIDAQGVMFGGSSITGQGILEKRSEIKSIKSLCEELAGKVAAAEGAFAKTRIDIEANKLQLEERREKLHAIDIERLRSETALKALEDELSRVNKLVERFDNELIEALRGFADAGIKKASLSVERDEIEGGIAAREAKQAEIAVRIAALSARKDEMTAGVTEIKVALAHSGEREGGLKRDIAERRRFVEDAQRRIAGKRDELAKGGTEAAEKTGSIEKLRLEIEKLLLESDEIKKTGAVLAEKSAELNAKLKEIEASVKEMKSALSEMQELKGELTIELKETELNLANLKERIVEKYGSDISHYAAASKENVEGAGDSVAQVEPDPAVLEVQRDELREKIASLGEVSLSALEEFNELERRHQFLVDQQLDLGKSVEALMSAITRINRTTREKFKTAFDEISAKFQETFPRFFNGGKAELRLAEDADVLEAGIEIVVQPPGKRLQNITLLSGGEKALTATALIFAIFLTKPSPFCLLDEVDAPLDDANIDRFNAFVKDMSAMSQFLLITHNKKTMEMADALYGITMEEPGVSKTISVRF